MASPDEIAGIPLFEDLPPDRLLRLAQVSTRQRYRRGEVIFSEGDPATGFHFVLEGKVVISKVSSDGKQQILHVWGEGEPFGEVAVFAGGRFPAHAEAAEDCQTLFVPRSGLLETIRTDPEIALSLLGVLARRLQRLTSLLEAVSLQEVPARLASYLLALDDSQGAGGRIQLDLTKGQLASHLGTIPETLSRVVARMAHDGLVKAEGARGFHILDRRRLLDLATGQERLGRGTGRGSAG